MIFFLKISSSQVTQIYLDEQNPVYMLQIRQVKDVNPMR